ncbi:hypothetical protein [Photobacterium nomapromontoriensis]|uniref:hypothetical protein n=1 Tax=Photobacterium nomapromontoriensis TaxID=2910237 RepID=UPI003D0EDF0D
MTNTNVKLDTVNFKDILMTHVVDNATGQYPDIKKNPSTLFANQSEQIKRQLAVTAALELIRTDISASFSTGGTSSKSTYILENHMENLSGYADKIVEAMKVNDQ